MNNSEKLINSFSIALGIDSKQIIDSLEYQSIPEWDSISHMVLITQLEEDFEISFETDDVINLSSVYMSKEILKKFKISFE